MKRLYLLTLCSIGLSVCIFFIKAKNPVTISSGEGLVVPKEWLVTNTNPQIDRADRRPADQTFLTFPEWFLVFSPEEQAHYFKHHTSTHFPFMSHVAQIWGSYKIVNEQIKDHFPPNPDYHLMIVVIGTSASIEYSMKAWYETVVGRLTDTHESITDEDKFNAKFTQDYVDFIKDNPWYEFDFQSRLLELWRTTSFFDSHFLRKIERKYMLSSELLVKYVYGKLIGLGTKQVYDVALPTTVVVLDDGSTHNLPRYDKFSEQALLIARGGRTFKEIAGNNSAILVSVLVPQDTSINFENACVVFTQPLTSDLSTKRVALVVPVAQLSQLLRQMDGEKAKIEHVFDY